MRRRHDEAPGVAHRESDCSAGSLGELPALWAVCDLSAGPVNRLRSRSKSPLRLSRAKRAPLVGRTSCMLASSTSDGALVALALTHPSLGTVVLVGIWVAPDWVSKAVRAGKELREYRREGRSIEPPETG